MEKILEQIDGIIDGVFHLPKSQDTDFILAELQDLREMVASQHRVQADLPIVCDNCFVRRASGDLCENCGSPNTASR